MPRGVAKYWRLRYKEMEKEIDWKKKYEDLKKEFDEYKSSLDLNQLTKDEKVALCCELYGLDKDKSTSYGTFFWKLSHEELDVLIEKMRAQSALFNKS